MKQIVKLFEKLSLNLPVIDKDSYSSENTKKMHYYLCYPLYYINNGVLFPITEVRKSQIKGKESENSYQELKRSPKDRHTQTHGTCVEIFRQGAP